MNVLQKILIRLRLKEASQQDVAQAFRDKDIDALKLFLKTGLYPERAAAAAHLGRLKARTAIPDLVYLLWDDFEPVATAARESLKYFLPNPKIEERLEQARQYWDNRAKNWSLKREASYYDMDDPHNPRNPMVDKNRMKRLKRVKIELQKSIRFW
ncbi:MAG: hypothetical protein R2824_25165 [Saprospiraceae bacterium]|nr:hypothetical protein [Lewinella sp.]